VTRCLSIFFFFFCANGNVVDDRRAAPPHATTMASFYPSSSSWLSHLRVAALASRNTILVALLLGMAHLLLKRYIADTAGVVTAPRTYTMASNKKPAASSAPLPPGPVAAHGADEDEKALYAFIYGKTATSTASTGPSKPSATDPSTTTTQQSTSSASPPPPPQPAPRPGASPQTVKPAAGDSRDPLDQFFMSPMGNGNAPAVSVADLPGFSGLDLSGFAQL
jgi:hypothetical protein